MIARAGHYEPIAREGFPYLLAPAFLALVFWWVEYSYAAAILLMLTLAIALFFRNPERTPAPAEEQAILSPADGRVIDVLENAASPNLGPVHLRRVSIFMSIFDVHVNRSPISGIIKRITYTPGRFLDAREKASSEVNEQNSLVLEGQDGTIEVVQVAGKVARRISCWLSVGDRLRRGERFGLVHFGSRLDVYLPMQFAPLVAAGMRVKAGVTPNALTADLQEKPNSASNPA